MTWEILLEEQKIKIANICLYGKETSIMGICGDIERSNFKDVKEYKNGKFTVNTRDSFYTTVTVDEDYVIELWNELTK